MHIFSDLEGIRIAIEMERRGEAFYRRAAKVSKSQDTVDLLLALAEDERHHQAEFERLLPSMQRGKVIAGVDHQTPPEVSLENYRIFVELFKEYAGYVTHRDENILPCPVSLTGKEKKR